MGKEGALGLRDRRGAACCAPTMCMLRPYRVPPRLPRCLGRRGEVQNAARPRVPFGRPAIGPSAVRCPSACTRNAWIAWAPPVCSTYRYRLLWLSAMSLMPAPINAVPPFASTRPIAPSGAIAKADTEPAPLPVKPMRPSLVTTAQHGAPWCVSTAPLTSETPPVASSSYDEADPAASDTNSSSRWPKENPNGVPPAEGVVVGPLATPFASTAYTSSWLVFFSVTTRRRPSGLNDTCAGPTFEPERGRVAPAIAVRAPLVPSARPEMLPVPPAFKT